MVEREEEMDMHSQRTEKKAHSPISRLFDNTNGKMQSNIFASPV